MSQSDLPTPRCSSCNIDMVPREKKHHAWECSICGNKYRRVSNLQQHMESISLIDQLIARESDPEVKKILEKRLEEAEAHWEHCKKLEKAGVIFGDLEEWGDFDALYED